jgi:regulator of replication initiation timing
MRERLKEIIDELRGLVEQAQDALDERPVLQRLLTALRAKLDEAEAEEAEDEGEPQP